MNILIINGPNINLLGKRETDIYGNVTYEKLCNDINDEAEKLGVKIEIFQSNYEGELIEKIQKSYGKVNFIVANFAAFTHTSLALRDALLAVNIPFLEVHISNIFSRESFRQQSYIGDIAVGVISGLGTASYIYALKFAKDFLLKK